MGGTSGTEDADRATTTTTRAAAGEEEPELDDGVPTSAPLPSAPPRGLGELEGTWVDDASAVLAFDDSGVGGLLCEGPITVTFGADGTYERSGDVRCTLGGLTASGSVRTRGRYDVDRGRLLLTRGRASGRLALRGTALTPSDAFRDGTARVDVDGTTLAITFTDRSGDEVTHTYTRA